MRDVDENGRITSLGLSFEPVTTEVMPIVPGAATAFRRISQWLSRKPAKESQAEAS